MANDTGDKRNPGVQTRLVHTGKNAEAPGGSAVNPPLVRASTVLFKDTAEQRDMRARRGTERLFTYGARGTPTTFALEDAVSELEGAYRTRLFPSGLAAIGFTLLAFGVLLAAVIGGAADHGGTHERSSSDHRHNLRRPMLLIVVRFLPSCGASALSRSLAPHRARPAPGGRVGAADVLGGADDAVPRALHGVRL